MSDKSFGSFANLHLPLVSCNTLQRLYEARENHVVGHHELLLKGYYPLLRSIEADASRQVALEGLIHTVHDGSLTASYYVRHVEDL